jgi:hypothetical protein
VRGRSSLTSRYRVQRPSMLRSLGVLLVVVAGGWAGRRVIRLVMVTLLGTSQQPQVATVDDPIRADAPIVADVGGGGPGGGDAILSEGSGEGGEPADANGIPVEQAWPRFTAADGSFSVEFPVDPTVQQLPGAPPEITGVENTWATFASSQYAVTVYALAPGVSLGEPNAYLAMFTADEFGSNGKTLLSTQPGTYASSTSIDFTSRVDLTGDVIQGVIFITDARLYILIAGGPPGQTLDPQRFLDSLTLG